MRVLLHPPPLTFLLTRRIAESGASMGWRVYPPLAGRIEDGGSKILWNVGILLQHCTTSQLRRFRLESSLPWKYQISLLNCFDRKLTFTVSKKSK